HGADPPVPARADRPPRGHRGGDVVDLDLLPDPERHDPPQRVGALLSGDHHRARAVIPSPPGQEGEGEKTMRNRTGAASAAPQFPGDLEDVEQSPGHDAGAPVPAEDLGMLSTGPSRPKAKPVPVKRYVV